VCYRIKSHAPPARFSEPPIILNFSLATVVLRWILFDFLLGPFCDAFILVYFLDYQGIFSCLLPKPSCLSVSPILITAFAVVLTANLFTFCRYTSPSVIFLPTLASFSATYAPFTPLVLTGNTRALRLTASAGTFL